MLSSINVFYLLAIFNYLIVVQQSRYKILKLYHEDIYGHLIFNIHFSRLVKELTSIYYDRRLRYKDYRRKGISFRIDIRHPRRYFKRITFLGRIIINRHKLRRFYGNLRSYQLRRTFYKSLKLHGILANNFPKLLESRLDVVMYRANLGITYEDIRQLIIHNGLYINGKIVNTPSQILRTGDKITIPNGIKASLIEKIMQKYKSISHNQTVELHSKAIRNNLTKICVRRRRRIIRMKHRMKDRKYMSRLKRNNHFFSICLSYYVNAIIRLHKYLIRIRTYFVNKLNKMDTNIRIVNALYSIQKRNIFYLYTTRKSTSKDILELHRKAMYLLILNHQLRKEKNLITSKYRQLNKLASHMKLINKHIIKLKLLQMAKLKTHKKLYRYLYMYRLFKIYFYNKFPNCLFSLYTTKKYNRRNKLRSLYTRYNINISKFIKETKHKQFKHKIKLTVYKKLRHIFHKLYKMRKLRYRTMKKTISKFKKRNYYHILYKRKYYYRKRLYFSKKQYQQFMHNRTRNINNYTFMRKRMYRNRNSKGYSTV